MVVNKSTILVTGGATLICAVSWAFLPSLQSGPRKVDAAAAVHVERARRMVDQYNPGLAYRANVVDQLEKADVEIEKLDHVAADAAEVYQEEHEALWKAFEPKDYDQDIPRPVKASYGNLASQIREGVKTRGALTAENNKLLKDALAELEEALKETSGATLAEANRLKGVIFHHRGRAEQVRAGLLRAEASAPRRRLVRLANEASQWTTARTLVADSGVDSQIQKSKDEIAKTEGQLVEGQKEMTALDARIKDLESRIAEARGRADQARNALEKLGRDGVDFSDPHAAAGFAKKMETNDLAYRQAIREVQSLEAGALPKAQIDASGDFLRGRYLEAGSATELTIQTGLSHDRNERSALATRVEGLKLAAGDLKSDLKRLEGIRAAYQAAQDDAVRRISDAVPLAAQAFEELNRVESEAATLEDGAIKLLDQAAAACGQAAGALDQWMNDAQERTQGLTPKAKERSAHSERENDGWMAGHIAAQAADVRLEKAWIYYQRFAAATENAGVLADAKATLNLGEADPSVETTKSDDARTKGIEEVGKALEILEKAHRRADKHWTFTAQAAGTTYLMALFGQPDYVADAVETYRAALKGRENEKFTEKLAIRLRRLESRKP